MADMTDTNHTNHGGDYPAYLDNGGTLSRDEWEAAGYPEADHKAEVERYLDDLGMVRKDFPDYVVDLADQYGTGVLDSYMKFNMTEGQ